MAVHFSQTFLHGSPKLDNRAWIKPFKLIKEKMLDILNEAEKILAGKNITNPPVERILETVMEIIGNERKFTFKYQFFFILDLYQLTETPITDIGKFYNDNFKSLLMGLKYKDKLNPNGVFDVTSSFLYKGNMKYLNRLYGINYLKLYINNPYTINDYFLNDLSDTYQFSYTNPNDEDVKEHLNANGIFHGQALFVGVSEAEFEVEIDKFTYEYLKIPNRIPTGKSKLLYLTSYQKYHVFVEINKIKFKPKYVCSFVNVSTDKSEVLFYPIQRGIWENGEGLAKPKAYLILSQNNYSRFKESNLYVWNDEFLYVHYKGYIMKIQYDSGNNLLNIIKLWKISDDIKYTRIQNFHTLCYLLHKGFYDDSIFEGRLEEGVSTIANKESKYYIRLIANDRESAESIIKQNFSFFIKG